MKSIFSLATFAVLASAQTANWTRPSTPAFPPPRTASAMAYDASNGQMVLFGGYGASALGDTWVWDGSIWTQKSPANSPAARFNHAMAYDSVNKRVVLFGGMVTGVGAANDTWLWDGANWAKQAPPLSPPARAQHSMTYDSGHQQGVMFGGENANLFALNDTWLWNGGNWSQGTPAAPPTARTNSALAYDAAHNQVVMFGGSTQSAQGVSNDTWIWDGTNWTKQSPQTSPPARWAHSLSYDSAHKQTVLFGGWNINVFNDTWLWDGTNWTQSMPAGSPNGRHNAAMAFDSAHGQTVLYGGSDPTFDYGDTWIWQIGTPVVVPPGPVITKLISASSFGGSTTVAPGSWIEIYGSNLAPDSRSWTGADFIGSTAPTTLDTVQVSIAGQKAAVAYISPTQVNAQLPSTLTGGMQTLTVTNSNGTSTPFAATIALAQPGLLAPPSFAIGGSQYVVALMPDNTTYILPPGTITGIASRQAKPGETIILYGIGFGGVTPSMAAGQIVTLTNQLTSNLQVLFGGVPATVIYDGLAPGFVGLYQFNVVVPQIANSDLVPLTFTLGGVPGIQPLYTSVKQ